MIFSSVLTAYFKDTLSNPPYVLDAAIDVNLPSMPYGIAQQARRFGSCRDEKSLEKGIPPLPIGSKLSAFVIQMISWNSSPIFVSFFGMKEIILARKSYHSIS